MMSRYLIDNELTTTQSRTISNNKKLSTWRKRNRKNVFVLQSVCRNLIVELVSKQKAFPVECRTKQNLKAESVSQVGDYCITDFCIIYLPSDCPS